MEIPTFGEISEIAPAAAITLIIAGVSVWTTLKVIKFTLDTFNRKDD